MTAIKGDPSIDRGFAALVILIAVGAAVLVVVLIG